eukprot:6213345-Pleurochrysis_carterae.AAC.4
MSGEYPCHTMRYTEDDTCCDAALVGVGPFTSNASSSSYRSTRSPFRSAAHACALNPALDSCATPNAAAVDAGVAVLEIVRLFVGLEEKRLQLQRVGRAVRQGERKTSLAQEL